MAIKIYEQFAPFANPADGDYPHGSFKNDSIPGAEDGTPLDAVWANDYAGTDAELFAQAGIVPNGQPDKLGASQRVDAMRAMFSNVGTVADIAAGKFKVGARVSVTDRSGGVFEIVSGGVADGIKILPAGGSNTAEMLLDGYSAKIGKFGPAGDGVFNDTSSVNTAFDSTIESVELEGVKKYLVDSWNNPLGVPARGKGQIVKSVTGGLEMQNSYVDECQRMTGQENLAAWFNSLLQPLSAPVIVLSGDSTTEGDGTTPLFKLDLLVKDGIRARGLQTAYGTDVRNKGHSGDTAAQWAATYVYLDIADNPDLYVVRWGINDVKDVDVFAANLRAGLAAYRAAKPFDVSSILLMMPNSTYDIPNNRDAKWYEQLRDIYVQAARDYKCAFIDTYAITQNSKGLANLLMDDPYGDGRGIHPNDLLNSIIAGYIVDCIAPFGASIGYGVNNIMLTSGAESPAINTTFLPTQYDGAVNIIRVQPAYGWPIDGNAITFKSQDGTSIQYVYGYSDADRGKLFVRFGRAELGGQPEGWSEFLPMGIRVSSASIAGIGDFNPSTSRCTLTGTTVVIDSKMTTASPVSVSIGQNIGTVPVGYRPTREIMYGTATCVNNAGSTFTQIPINVQTDGTISCAGVASNVSLVYLSVVYDVTP